MWRRRKIDGDVALAIAGQVSVGLAPGEAQAARARLALTVIGTMVRQASGRNENVAEILELAWMTEDDPPAVLVPDDRDDAR